MTKIILVACCVLSAVLLLACSKTETTPGNTASAPANKPAAAATTPAAANPVSSSNKTGVAECDDFIAAYEACVKNKVPAAAQAQFNQSLTQTRQQWKKLAENPQTKPSLVAACKQAIETSRTAMKAYGCTF